MKIKTIKYAMEDAISDDVTRMAQEGYHVVSQEPVEQMLVVQTGIKITYEKH